MIQLRLVPFTAAAALSMLSFVAFRPPALAADAPLPKTLTQRQTPASASGITASFLGGSAFGLRDGDEHGLGLSINGVVGYEIRLRRGSFSVTPELMIAYDRWQREGKGVDLGGIFAGGRGTYYVSPEARHGLALWTSVHVGPASHTDDKVAHVALLFGAGLTYMLMPQLGIGLFGDAMLQTSGVEHPNTIVESHGGGTLSFRFGLQVKTKIPI